MSWLRTNRWWLPLLPLVILGMVAASSYRVKGLWYDAGLHRAEVTAAPGEAVRVVDGYDDAFGATSRTFRVRLTRIGTASSLPSTGFDTGPTGLPKGSEVLVAHLDWAAEPDQSLTGCDVALVDRRGVRYQVPVEETGFGGPQTEPCVPSDHAGPDPAIDTRQPRGYVEKGDARPPTWSTTVSFLVPQGTDADRVLVWWSKPDYVALDAPSS